MRRQSIATTAIWRTTRKVGTPKAESLATAVHKFPIFASRALRLNLQVLRRYHLFVPAVLLIATTAAFVFYEWQRGFRTFPAKADKILVEKGARRLILFSAGRKLKEYRIVLGFSPIGPKEREGDGRTPEGNYSIDFHKPDSAFHRALHISYPSVEDSARAAVAGESAGGDIMIHGLPNALGALAPAHRLRDWTAGCIAVTDSEIEEIYNSVNDGTPIEIRP